MIEEEAIKQYIAEMYDEYCEENFNEIREWFEEMTLDACDHRNSSNIDECEDGYDDYCMESFEINFWLTAKMTIFEKYKQLLYIEEWKNGDALTEHKAHYN